MPKSQLRLLFAEISIVIEIPGTKNRPSLVVLTPEALRRLCPFSGEDAFCRLHLSGQQGKDVLRLFQGEWLMRVTAGES